MRRLLRTRFTQAVLAHLMGGYLAFALRTTRWTFDGQEHFAPHVKGAAAVFAFWHEFLPLMPALVLIARRRPYYQPRPIHALVSQHRDGRFVGEVVRRFGIEPVLGSTSRGGPAGLRTLLRLLRRGAVIGITPDGPRGPRRVAAPGVVQLASAAGVPVLPCAARTRHRIVLGTWDRMPLPLPFGRGVVVCGPSVAIPRDGWQAAMPAVTAALNRAAERADMLCRT